MTGVLDYNLERAVLPTLEPIGLNEAKHQCNISLDEPGFDSWFESGENNVGAIAAARELVESDAQLSLMNQTYVLRIGEWPCGPPAIDLKIHPVRSLTVAYLDVNGDSQAWASSNYDLIRSKFRSHLVKTDADTDWPIVATDKYLPITITMVAGYPDPTTDTTDIAKRAKVPNAAKNAMLMLVAHWFKNREAILVGSISKEIERSYRSLIDSLRPQRYL